MRSIGISPFDRLAIKSKIAIKNIEDLKLQRIRSALCGGGKVAFRYSEFATIAILEKLRMALTIVLLCC